MGSQKVLEMLDQLQGYLEFEGCTGLQFKTKQGLGRIAIGGFGLGLVLGVHTVLLILALFIDFPLINNFTLVQWALYVVCLMLFHFGEFIVTCVYKPDTVSYDSFVINHSKGYTMAAILSWIEFWVEVMILPSGFKVQRYPLVFIIGLGLVFTGQFFRAAAMWTAKSNFNHIIMQQREETHQLVKHGVYKYFRHPSYFGWYWWCVGTQILLCNPVCTLAYAYVAMQFFRDRVPYEEALLCQFYKEEYPAYMATTWIGIPGVKGWKPPTKKTN